MEAGIEAAGKAEVEGAKAKARAGEEGAEAAIKTTLEKELAEEAKAREEATVKYQGETEDVSEDKVTGGLKKHAQELLPFVRRVSLVQEEVTDTFRTTHF